MQLKWEMDVGMFWEGKNRTRRGKVEMFLMNWEKKEASKKLLDHRWYAKIEDMLWNMEKEKEKRIRKIRQKKDNFLKSG